MYIETKNLVKTFSGRNVVDGVSLRVDKGQVVGLLGPNGAGKTTSFYMIVGIDTAPNILLIIRKIIAPPNPKSGIAAANPPKQLNTVCHS